jgi:hypothetical protein
MRPAFDGDFREQMIASDELFHAISSAGVF